MTCEGHTLSPDSLMFIEAGNETSTGSTCKRPVQKGYGLGFEHGNFLLTTDKPRELISDKRSEAGDATNVITCG